MINKSQQKQAADHKRKLQFIDPTMLLLQEKRNTDRVMMQFGDSRKGVRHNRHQVGRLLPVQRTKEETAIPKTNSTEQTDRETTLRSWASGCNLEVKIELPISPAVLV